MPDEKIFYANYEIRARKVVLEKELAEMCGVGTKALKQALRRNPDRFPAFFMFGLTPGEWDQLKESLRTRNVT